MLPYYGPPALQIEAADEIDNLREELSIWKSVFPDIAPSSVLPDRSLLEAEIERLRAALEGVLKAGVYNDACECMSCEMARAALAQGGE